MQLTPEGVSIAEEWAGWVEQQIESAQKKR
jgi:hypothetical protein